MLRLWLSAVSLMSAVARLTVTYLVGLMFAVLGAGLLFWLTGSPVRR